MSRDILLLHPQVKAMAMELVEKCKAQKLNVLITETFRTKEEQQDLYNKGRTTTGSIVTNVKYPNSYHCWGIAIDFCKNKKGHEYDDEVFFKSVAKIGKEIGFTWGGDWTSFRDIPHLQYDMYGTNTLGELKIRYGTPEKFKASWVGSEIPHISQKKVMLKVIQMACNTDGYTDSNKSIIKVTGELDEPTIEALHKVTIKNQTTRYFEIVRVVQRMLAEVVVSCKDLLADGYAGINTAFAVLDYQKSRGLDPTGVIDYDVIVSLLTDIAD